MPVDPLDAGPARRALAEWRAQGRLAPAAVTDAWTRHHLDPDAARWHQLLGAGLLAAGVLSLGSGIVFFFAYNWAAWPPFAKFGTLAALLVACTVAAYRLAALPRAGVAAVFLAQVVTGVLLATIGQAYQTGADAWQLFALWAALAAAWALAARAAPPWWLVVVLLLVALLRYLSVQVGFGPDAVASFVFGVHGLDAALTQTLATLALLGLWELLARGAAGWGFRGVTGPRLLMAAACGAAFWLGVSALFGVDIGSASQTNAPRLATAFAVLALQLAAYRWLRLDLFSLALAGLCAAVLVTLSVGRLAGPKWADLWLPLGLLLVGQSAALAVWLRRLATVERSTVDA